MEDREVLHSTLEQVEKFIGSAVWRDLRAMLAERIRMKHLDLEQAGDIEQIRFIQGEISEARWLEGLPETLLDEHKERIREDSKQKEAEDVDR